MHILTLQSHIYECCLVNITLQLVSSLLVGIFFIKKKTTHSSSKKLYYQSGEWCHFILHHLNNMQAIRYDDLCRHKQPVAGSNMLAATIISPCNRYPGNSTCRTNPRGSTYINTAKRIPSYLSTWIKMYIHGWLVDDDLARPSTGRLATSTYWSASGGNWEPCVYT
jgi:hypothetical protein